MNIAIVAITKGGEINVTMSGESPLCKYYPTDGFTNRYGWRE